MHGFLVFMAAVVSLPAIVFVVECLLGLLPLRSRAKRSASARPSVAVLVPAHDEEAVLAGTLASIQAQLEPRDRVLVVADNCTDRTAEIARASGADVMERTDPAKRGKGFALALGAKALAEDPPDVVVVVDADCRLSPGCLSALAHTVVATGRPAQGEYVLAGAPRSPLMSINALAVLVRNKVRPRGLHRIGGPCQLTGSGMAFPFALASGMEALGSSIVEDLVLGLALAHSGHAPMLCPEARIEGELPQRRDAALGQRRRWEHGQLATLRSHGPRLLGRGLVRGDLDAFLLGIDLLVPPLSLLILIEFGAAALAAVPAFALALSLPLAWTGGALLAVGVTSLLAWARFGHPTIPFVHLLAAPFYVAWKLPLYGALLFRRGETRWVRTRRNAEEPRT